MTVTKQQESFMSIREQVKNSSNQRMLSYYLLLPLQIIAYSCYPTLVKNIIRKQEKESLAETSMASLILPFSVHAAFLMKRSLTYTWEQVRSVPQRVTLLPITLIIQT